MKDITIQASQLRTLLADPKTYDQTLKKYFDVKMGDAFQAQYPLKKGVTVIPDESPDGAKSKSLFFDIKLEVANWVAILRRDSIYRNSVKDHPNRVRIVAEGDSWFHHPDPAVEDIIENLQNHYSIKTLGAGGDELSEMFKEAEYLPTLQQEQPRFFLLSGGGNDFLGKSFKYVLKDYTQGKPGSRPERFLKGRFFDTLNHVLNIYDRIFEHMTVRFPNITLIVHGYDYPIPWRSDHPKLKKSWIGKHLKNGGLLILKTRTS